MAWSWGDGFDLYAAPADAINGYWDSGSVAASTLNAGRFSGSQALSPASSATFIKSSGANDAVHHLVVAFRQTSILGAATATDYLELFDGATAQCSIAFRGDGSIVLTSGGPAGTVLDTYSSAFIANTWFAFEFEVVINNSTGSWAVRKNGNTSNDHALGSLNTRPTSTNNYANKLQIGSNSGAFAQALDDLFWRSDASSVAWLGDLRCYTRMPASDASVQFSRTPTGALTQTVPTAAIGVSTAIVTSQIRLTQFTAAYSGTVTSVGVVVNVTPGGNMKCAIYADNAGSPGVVLASATTSVTTVSGTNVFTFSPGATIVKGVVYWIAACCDTNGGSWQYAAAGGSLGASAPATYSTFPQNSPAISTNQIIVQMQWTYTATPANWQAVAEPQQDGTTSYVFDSTPGDADFYGIGSIASTPVTTFAVVTRGYMQKSDAGTRTAAVQIKSGGTTVASPTLVLTTSGFLWAWRMDLTDPNTSAAWTAAGVNGVQIGPTTVA